MRAKSRGKRWNLKIRMRSAFLDLWYLFWKSSLIFLSQTYTHIFGKKYVSI